MPYAQSEVSDLKAALDPLAKTMASSLGGPRTDQVLALLNSHLRVDVSTTLRPLTDAVQKPENAEAIQAAEKFWAQFPEPQTSPAAAPATSPMTLASAANQSTIEHATQHNNTTIYLAYITTFGFFFLVACLIGFDRFPSIFAIIKGSTAGSADGAASSAPYRDILMTLMGVIGTAWAGIISFYFGSSVGSRQQSETLQNISRDASTRPNQPR